MGQSTNAILAYGYDLGGSDEWKIREVGEYGEFPERAWHAGDNVVEDAERHLLSEIAGFTEVWGRGNEGYLGRLCEAEARLGVTFETYCSDGYPMYLLAAHVTTVHRGDVEAVDPVDLAQRPAAEGWDAKLRAAVAALGITPVQPEPRWLLCSYWG